MRAVYKKNFPSLLRVRGPGALAPVLRSGPSRGRALTCTVVWVAPTIPPGRGTLPAPRVSPPNMGACHIKPRREAG